MSQVKIVVREACLQDSAAIADILRAVGWFDINTKAPEQTQARVAAAVELALREKTNTILVAEYVHGDTSGHVVGYVAVHWFSNLMFGGNEGYVSELFIHPAETGKGIGSRLLDTVNAYALERSCLRLFLINKRTRESYQRGFYRKHGWEELSDKAFFSHTLPVLS